MLHLSSLKQKLLVILGPTASGKSSLAVNLAKRYSGEVISADSRQIYTGLDIGTGKITQKEMGDIPHHLLNILDVGKKFSVVNFKENADRAIHSVHTGGKLPILAGGTGLYIRAVIDNWLPPEVPIDQILRNTLSDKSPDELFALLQKTDPERARAIDKNNSRRLVRALEITHTLGSVPKIEISFPKDYEQSPYNVLQIGLLLEDAELRKRIQMRVTERIKNGFIKEVEELSKKLSQEQLYEIGLGYRIIAEYPGQMRTKESLIEAITASEWQYAKRQMRWFKRDSRIIWINAQDNCEKRVQEFLAN